MLKFLITSILYFFLSVNIYASDRFNDAEIFVKSFSDQAINILSNSGINENERSNLFTNLVMNSIDLDLISKFVLSKAWKSASDDQKKDYNSVFEKYFINSYANKLNQYSGEQVEIFGSEEAGKYIIVDSNIIKGGTDTLKINIKWRLLNKNAKFKIIDLNIEGISLVIAQREEFQSFLMNNNSDIDLLINKLKSINN